MIDVFMIVTVLFLVAITIYISKKSAEMKTAQREGVTTDAVVLSSVYVHRYFKTKVRFVGDDNQEHEASLVTIRRMSAGDVMKIAYMPPQYKVIFAAKDQKY